MPLGCSSVVCVVSRCCVCQHVCKYSLQELALFVKAMVLGVCAGRSHLALGVQHSSMPPLTGAFDTGQGICSSP